MREASFSPAFEDALSEVSYLRYHKDAQARKLPPAEHLVHCLDYARRFVESHIRPEEIILATTLYGPHIENGNVNHFMIGDATTADETGISYTDLGNRNGGKPSRSVLRASKTMGSIMPRFREEHLAVIGHLGITEGEVTYAINDTPASEVPDGARIMLARLWNPQEALDIKNDFRKAYPKSVHQQVENGGIPLITVC